MQSPQNTLKIHGRVLWHLPVTTDGFIIKTGPDRRLYNQDRSLPTTLYTFYTIRQSPSEDTENTRSCIMTSTGHDRRLYKHPTQVLGLRSTGVGIWYFDPGRALPTVRIIVPSSPRVSVWPNTTAQSISEWYMVVGHSLIERVTIISYLTDYENTLSPTCNTLQIHSNLSGFLHIHTWKVLLPHSKHYY